MMDAIDAAQAHAEKASPRLATRWRKLAERIATLRANLASLPAAHDVEAMRAELAARIERYLTADRGEDLLSSIVSRRTNAEEV